MHEAPWRPGYPVGDLLLREVAERLGNCVQESDLVARLGGDAFAVVQGEMIEPADAGGLIAPGVFIPIAEREGSMAALGRWVLDQACRQMRAWRDEGVAPLMIAINLSLFELRSAQTFVRDVAEAAAK